MTFDFLISTRRFIRLIFETAPLPKFNERFVTSNESSIVRTADARSLSAPGAYRTIQSIVQRRAVNYRGLPHHLFPRSFPSNLRVLGQLTVVTIVLPPYSISRM